ncbi:MAG: hypothetical protein QOF78_3610 [Phycisphaerales bacterium]|nr:hypothetical protein [Phycisphaerales bacterium]MEA2736376.1 hypothetical protein [Humisphaera sp.]
MLRMMIMTVTDTDPVSVKVHRAGTLPKPGELEIDLARVRQIAKLLDAQFEIGGIKFGWDSIVGLIPVVGDIAMALVGTYPLYIARKHNLGKFIRARMISNLVIDWAVGSVPIVGDVFDVGFKAHLKNAALLEKAAEKARRNK